MNRLRSSISCLALSDVISPLVTTCLAGCIFVSGCGGGGGGNGTISPPPPSQNPTPTVTAVSPSSIAAGAGDTKITVVGSGFINSTTVTVAGSTIPITSVSSSQVVATLPSTDFSLAKNLSLAISNPSPGGGTATATISVIPQLVSVQPSSVVVGSNISISVLGADTQNLANNSVKLTQTGRTFSATPSTASSQAGTTILNVVLPSGMSPTNAKSSLSLPTSVSLTVNGVSSQGTLAIQLHSQPHAIAASPATAEQNTSFVLTLVGAFTSFDSSSAVTGDDPGLVLTNVSVQSPSLITASMSIGAGTGAGDHVISVISGGSSIPFHFAVLPSSSNAPVLTGLSSNQLAPGAALTLSGSGFLPAEGTGQTQILYSYAGVSAEGSVRTSSDTQIVVPMPLLMDPSTGTLYTGNVSVQVAINGKASNAESLSIIALPANRANIGDTTKAYLTQLQSKLNAISTQVTPIFAADGGTSYNSFVSGTLTELEQLQLDVATAASGGKVTTPDGSVIDQSTVDLFDRLFQSSGAPVAMQAARIGECQRDPFQLASQRAQSPVIETTTVTLSETTLLAAGASCKAGDVLGDISGDLNYAAIGSCAASLIPALAPVAGPICGFLKLFSTAETLVELANLACDVAPVNLASVSPNPLSVSTTINGQAVTEMPSAVFKSAGDALSQDAETTTDLILSTLHFDEGPWRYITGNKVVAAVLNDAFQAAFTNLVGNALDTQNTQVFYFQTNPIQLTAVALEPSANGFFTFSGLAMQPGSNAGSTNLYFDTSSFRTLDPAGNVTNVSSIVTGNQIPAVIHSIVTVSPGSATVAPGGQAQFQAFAAGVGPIWGFTWSVDNVSGGGPTAGYISSSGIYTAPLTTGTHTITATSLFDFSSGSATVTLTGTASSISITPQTAIVPEGSVQTFVANVQGGGNAIWSIQEGIPGGTISGSGIYTAPKQAGTYHVVATNSANSSEIATAIVTVVPGPSIETIHSFNHATEGAIPWNAPIFGSDGNLYGVTQAGGNLSCAYQTSFAGCGTIYKSDTTGNLATLYSFSGRDGAYPVASLTQGSNGSFYGTTSFGGTNTSECVVNGTSTPAGCGALFSLALPNSFALLYSFGPFYSPLAVSPQAPLIQANSGHWYGSTIVGGNSSCSGRIGTSSNTGCGSIFAYSSANGGSALHTFSGSDGAYPEGALLQQKDGNFYGITSGGGLLTCSSYDSLGCGTVFQMTSAGAIKTLHSFSSTDGAHPYQAMILGSDGWMYGVTVFGGSTTCSGGAQWIGCGTVFKIDTSGNFTALHSFSGSDGAYPTAIMQATDGYFYGTTQGGGDVSCSGRYGPGCGTVFKMDSAGNVTVLYSFTGQSDGSWPESGVIQGADGNLYGTTAYGGTNDDGVIFRISNLKALAAAKAQSESSEVTKEPIAPLLMKRPHLGPPGPPAPAQQ